MFKVAIAADSSQSGSRLGKRQRISSVPLAVGGRYDQLLLNLKRQLRYGSTPLNMSVCGVMVSEEVTMNWVARSFLDGKVSLVLCCVSISRCRSLSLFPPCFPPSLCLPIFPLLLPSPPLSLSLCFLLFLCADFLVCSEQVHGPHLLARS